MNEVLEKASRIEASKDEFAEFVRAIAHDLASTEAESDLWVQHFDKLVSPHPQRNGLISGPKRVLMTALKVSQLK